MKPDGHTIIEACSADLADNLLVECCRCLGRPERIEDVMCMVQTNEVSRPFSDFVELEAAAQAGDRPERGKLRDGVIILDPEFVRALLAKVDAFPSETKSDPSPAKRPVATSTVAGKPDRAVVAPEPEAMLTPSATPNLPRRVNYNL